MRPRPASPFRARGARPSSGTLGRAASLAAPESRWRAVRERWGERLSASRASGRRSWTVLAAARQWARLYRWTARRAGKWPAAATSTSRPVPRVLPRCTHSYRTRTVLGELVVRCSLFWWLVGMDGEGNWEACACACLLGRTGRNATRAGPGPREEKGIVGD